MPVSGGGRPSNWLHPHENVMPGWRVIPCTLYGARVSRRICQGMIVKRLASLQLSIAKIQAIAGSRDWKFKRCGYKRITLVTCSIVRVQCLTEYFPVHNRR